ncbi:MAG: VWA domain-containing protein [Chthoniobacterales bacterium]
MNKNYTAIAFILDRSGSMERCQDAAIEGFNRFLREQQTAEGLAKLTLVLFDDEYLVPARSLPVAEILPLDSDTYVPRGSTALLDAIGQTIGEVGKDLASIPEQDRPAQVIVAILTDGLENASEKYTWKQVARLIKQQTEQYRWTFLFLGANQDAIATAAQISIAAANSATYVADAPGSRAVHRSLSRKMRSMRSSAMGTATLQEQADAAAPMADLVDEEDRRERTE